MTWLWLSLSLTLLFSALGVQPVQSQGVQIEFGETKIENHFPEGIKFSVKIDVQDHRGSVYFHYQLGNDFWTYSSPNCSAKITNNGLYVEHYTCTFFLHLENIPPQLPITYKWELYATPHRFSEKADLLYEDPNFEWQSAADNNLRVWWHDRPTEFGETVLATAKTAVENQRPLFGVDLDKEIQIVVQNSLAEYHVWHEEVAYPLGGQAFPEFGTTIQIVELDMSKVWMDYWLDEVIPHEISHLYFFRAGVRDSTNPPVWLNEGLAGYNEFGEPTADWDLVNEAVEQGTLIPLADLRKEFGGDDHQVSLSYAESTTAIVYLIETYGEQSISSLFAAYREGNNSEQSFEVAFGRSITEIEKEWDAWVKEKVKEQARDSSLSFQIGLVIWILGLVCSCGFVLLIIGLIVYYNRPAKPNPV